MNGTLAAWVIAGILLVLVVSASLTQAQGNVAVWSSGDSWQWRGSLGAAGPFLFTMTVLDAESLTVSGVSYASYHMRLWNNFTSGAPDSRWTGDIWYRVSDLAVLQSILEFNVSVTGTANGTSTVTYNPPLPLQFPLVANDMWLASTTATDMTTSPSQPTSWHNTTLTMTASVGRSVPYTVPAGTFNATLINETIASPSNGQQTCLYYWSSGVGNSVTGPFLAPGVFVCSGMQLISYHYTPPSTPASAPTLNPLWLFVGGVAVGAGVVALVAAALIFRYRGPRKPNVREPESPSQGPKS